MTAQVLVSFALLAGAGLATARPAAAATVEIAPVGEALTFARVESEGRRRVILVERYHEDAVSGVDLSLALGRAIEDPVTVYRELGYTALAKLPDTAAPTARVTVDAGTLVLPLELSSHHIAAGTNYPELGDEAGVEDGPFLFAKLVTPTPPRADLSAGSALLDYEVELAWIALGDITEAIPPEELGAILCNDYTDRETLLRHLDAWNPASGKGFSTGKSFPGYLPVGDLFVIPRDYRKFGSARTLTLTVNDEIRQQSAVSAAIWDVDELFAEAWKRRDVRWEHRGGEVSLFNEGGVIEARSLILSGTPAGTVFQSVGLTHKLRGAWAWALDGFSEPIASYVIEAYLSDPQVRAAYLKPGDRVTIRADYLGTIRNMIVP